LPAGFVKGGFDFREREHPPGRECDGWSLVIIAGAKPKPERTMRGSN
jgi:hypothetical protein